MASHEVFNQPPPLQDYDVVGNDTALVEAVEREGAAWALADLARLGAEAGSAELIEAGFEANRNEPELHTHDRFGHRSDTVTYHPAYHHLMERAVAHGLHAAPWADERPGAHVARAAGFYAWMQAEAGHGCPISMTYSVVPALRNQPELAAEWEPQLVSRTYDRAFVPSQKKSGLLAGMGMTEKQGGSDVRANTTAAVPVDGGGPAGEYRLTGHKWFCSAPMCDLFLMLAQAPGGLSCFLVPRFTPDGERNVFRIQRLKDKLGNRSNASSEVELDGTYGLLVGEEGRGVATIISMVNHTRLDCIIGAAATMRQAVTQALHHTRHRSAFGKLLVDQPLMTNVLADLSLEVEAATTVMLRLARAYDAEASMAAGTDRSGDPSAEAAFRRLATAVVKYWVCKRCPPTTAEAMECLGGNGYIEESMLPRLFRESPLNGIWEGSGNVICLDVLRAMVREPASLEAFRAEIELARGADARLDAHLDRLHGELSDLDGIEARARRIVEAMALALQGSLLVRHAPDEVAEAFCATRLAGDWGRAFGTLPRSVDAMAIVERAWPA
jgi:putative acyl-CoA dehydrogenase